MPQQITEAIGSAQKTGPGRVKFKIITPGQGSSGNYTEAMLRQAARDNVFPEGTLSMVNHPTGSEHFERPEGDLRNLAGVLLEDAYWDGTALVAEARIGSAWRDFVDEFHEYIGVSISAQAEVTESGEISRLLPDPFNRVDLVTVAGRGGEITEVLEAAKVIESRSIIAKETTEHDIGMWLNSAIRDKIAGWTYAIDHDAEYVYYEADDETGRQRIYRRSYTLNGSTITLGDDPVEVRRRTEYDPVQDSQPTPAGDPETQDQEVATMATIDEQELHALQEKARRADELAAENQALKEAQAAQAAESRKAKALAAVEAAFGEEAPAFYVTAAETAAASENYDHDAFKAMVDEAAGHTAQEAGTPNLGDGAAPVQESKSTVTDEDIVAVLEGKK